MIIDQKNAVGVYRESVARRRKFSTSRSPLSREWWFRISRGAQALIMRSEIIAINATQAPDRKKGRTSRRALCKY